MIFYNRLDICLLVNLTIDIFSFVVLLFDSLINYKWRTFTPFRCGGFNKYSQFLRVWFEIEQSPGGRKRKRENEGNEEKPKGVIHVRAKRGQATDSHSLAERVSYFLF